MKQNEKILVYVVTGLLFLILAVAVLFGKEGTSGTPGTVPGVTERGTAGANPGTNASNPGANGALSLEDLVNQARELAQAKPPADGGSGPGAIVPNTNLATSVQVAPPTPAEEVGMLLGRSQRDRDWRLVTVRSGDTLREMVLRWCGGIDAHWDEVLRLNEGGTVLQPGQTVVLPWVDDAEVLAAFRARQPQRDPAPAVPLDPAANTANAANAGANLGGTPVPAVVTPEPAPTPVRTYVVKPGDMLWKIAEREVGKERVPSFLALVKELNPGVDLDSLKVKQVLKLPAGLPN